jgi:hypothetical protein
LKREKTFHEFPSKGFLRHANIELDMVRIGNRNQELLRKEQQRQMVLEILRDNRDGLTSSEITMRIGYLSRTLLLELRDEGKVIQKKGYAKDGKVTYLYALAREMSIKEK